MNRDPEHILDLFSAVSGIIAFVWIGLRADLKGVGEAVRGLRLAQSKARALGRLFIVAGPYLLFGLFVLAVVVFAVRGPDIVVRHHRIKTVRTGTDVRTIDPIVEISSSDPQFEIALTGAIYGPELARIRQRYGSAGPTVFAVVCEQSVLEEKQSLAWVQYYQGAPLGPTGEYTVHAFLGGIGVDAAKPGDLFRVRIYIPLRAAEVSRTPYESLEALPKPLFLSEPIYVRCRRS